MPKENDKAEETVQVVVFGLDTEEYAVSIDAVQEVVKMPDVVPVPNSADYVAGVMNLRGRVLPILDLEKRFALKREGENGEKHVIIIDSEEVPFGVMVDEVSEVMRISTKALQKAPEAVLNKFGSDFVSGVALLQDNDSSQKDGNGDKKTVNNEANRGRLVLLLELSKIFSEREGQQIVEASEAGTNNKEN